MKKKVLYWLKGGVATEEQRAEARENGAQFRNSDYYDPENEEPADRVMGDVPEGSYIGVRGGSKAVSSADPDDTTGDDEKPASGGAGGDDEVEITLGYINGLKKDELIQLAVEEEITLAGTEKVDELKEILIEHFELQE